jgi:hypothetical protein
MTGSLLTAALLLLMSVGTLIEGRCSICVLLSQRSTVQAGTCTSTLVASLGYYDEHGKYRYADPNTVTCAWRCSRGHYLVTRTGGR